VTFDVTVVEELARFSVLLSYPLGRLPVNWANIPPALVFGTSRDGEQNQYDRKDKGILGHFV
jgi:hypothetical protein